MFVTCYCYFNSCFSELTQVTSLEKIIVANKSFNDGFAAPVIIQFLGTT